MTSTTAPACPVCRAAGPRHFGRFDGRAYWRCDRCEATGLDPAHFPDKAQEHAHYLHHENQIHDPGYRRFLSRLADPLLPLLTAGMRGLDYGCGPGPALAAMLTEAGYRMALYDPFFHPDPAPLTNRYDFITCTETAEHFHHPADEFDRLGAMLNHGGWLAVMTCFQTEDSRFGAWHYRKDPTHVVFYRAGTFRQIAQAHGWSCTIPANDVVLMQKPAA
ncbi:Methyltransferase domain-containing protein [Roseovarius azorensis]|uniref:Methyltransferase domain-containing protein n=1 Tax=Roseovarius azorensis TaxID=1287727 RepID=A0A1H7REM1_9RHOB|nr:class I SAM-dependent methyltransferase [Roseovarius azorensis]SEL58633.1 Methyltransferase domain-containing protein [Roseovarius azorensis]